MTRRPALALASLIALTLSGTASAEPLKLEAGKPVTLTCQTEAIIIKDNGPPPTKGTVALRLELKDAGSASANGTWTPVSTEDAHKGAFAAQQKTACASGCPMTVSASGDAQIWAPAPKSLDKLGADETLLLAVINAGKLDIKASMFRGQSIEGLEKGTCTVAP